MSQVTPPLPTVYLPHGGGPCFFMDWQMGPADTWDELADWLRSIPDRIGRRPEAIVLVSAHWEESQITVGAHPNPPLIFDYYGFPPHTYELTYPAPGNPELAERIRDRLEDAGIRARVDPGRGLDHGVFVPLKLVYPAADIPIVPLSLRADLAPELHLQVGRALAGLRSENVLIIGSGMSFHNMAAFGRPSATVTSVAFRDWLTPTVEGDRRSREQSLGQWTRAPQARNSHPREEHLIPLLVAAGAAGDDPGRELIRTRVMSADVAGYGFGEFAHE